MSEPAAETARAVLYRIPAVMRAIRSEVRRGRPAGISVPQLRALIFIRRRPGTDLSGVSEHLGTSAPATSELVSRLVNAGLVDRTLDPSSRRRVRLVLTPQGAADLDAAEEATLAWLADRLRDVPSDRLTAIAAALADLEGLLAESPAPPSR